jgi:hypothetical protein
MRQKLSKIIILAANRFSLHGQIFRLIRIDTPILLLPKLVN